MTIEIALSGLSYSMFCTLVSIFFICISLILSVAMIYCFIKALSFILKATKGGVDNLKENVKALSQSTVSDR
jgi:hypothetical protein